MSDSGPIASILPACALLPPNWSNIVPERLIIAYALIVLMVGGAIGAITYLRHNSRANIERRRRDRRGY